MSDIKCEPKAGELTQALYNCIREIVDKMSTKMVKGVYERTSKIVETVLVLAVMFFAIKFVLGGTRQPQAEFMIMLFKIVFVASMLFGIRTGGGILEFRDTILYAGSGLQNVVFAGGNAFGVSGENLFEQMDNMLFEFFGIKPDKPIDVDKDLATFGMMGGLMFAGPAGAKALAEGSAAVAMLVGAFVMALYINIIALIALTFLLAISPIFLPLLLFRQTETMFKKWRGQMISYSLQPMFVAAFLSMMLVVLAEMVGTFGNFVTIAKDMGNDPNVQSIRTALSTSTTVKGAGKLNTSVNLGTEISEGFGSEILGADAAAANPNEFKDQLTEGVATKDLSIQVTPFDKKQLGAFGSHIIVLLITIMIMSKFMRELPRMVGELSGGDDRIVPNLATTQPISQMNRNFEGKNK